MFGTINSTNPFFFKSEPICKNRTTSFCIVFFWFATANILKVSRSLPFFAKKNARSWRLDSPTIQNPTFFHRKEAQNECNMRRAFMVFNAKKTEDVLLYQQTIQSTTIQSRLTFFSCEESCTDQGFVHGYCKLNCTNPAIMVNK